MSETHTDWIEDLTYAPTVLSEILKFETLEIQKFIDKHPCIIQADQQRAFNARLRKISSLRAVIDILNETDYSQLN